MSSRTFPQAVLFDHDGTLMDTEPLWDLAKRRLAAEHGGTWTAQDTDDVMGRSIGLTLQRLRERGVELEDRAMGERLVLLSRELLREQDPELIPGVESLLEEVAAAGIPAGSTSCHEAPESRVSMIRNFPSTGSLIATPYFPPGQNARQS